MKDYLLLILRNKEETYTKSYGNCILQAMVDVDQKLEPEFFDCVLERYNTTSYENLDDALKRWTTRKSIKGYTQEVEGDWGAKWKRKKQPSYRCENNHMKINLNGDLVPSELSLTAKWNKSVDWNNLFKSWCSIGDTQIAFLHHFTEFEMVNKHNDFKIGSFGAWSNPRFPDISWAMMFGDDFAPRLNVDKLRELGFSADVVGSGILVRVTDDILDVSKRYDYFCERRELLRANLPHDFFIDPEEERIKVEEFTKMYLEYKGITPK